jgi:hypothetical protein
VQAGGGPLNGGRDYGVAGVAPEVTAHGPAGDLPSRLFGIGVKLTRSPGWLRKALLGMPLDQASFARRKFRGNDPRARERLEEIGRTFLHDYHAALLDDSPIASPSG